MSVEVQEIDGGRRLRVRIAQRSMVSEPACGAFGYELADALQDALDEVPAGWHVARVTIRRDAWDGEGEERRPRGWPRPRYYVTVFAERNP